MVTLQGFEAKKAKYNELIVEILEIESDGRHMIRLDNGKLKNVQQRNLSEYHNNFNSRQEEWKEGG